jgi:hypothetical protein
VNKRVQHSIDNYNYLKIEHKSLIPDFNDNCDKIRELIEKNQEFINIMIEDAQYMFNNQEFKQINLVN